MRPNLLLLPEVTEIQWTIRPRLEEWAEVRSFDPPGVGAEPGTPTGEALVARALAEVDDAGWGRFVIAAGAWALPTAVRVAHERPTAVAAMGLGHACLSTRRDGERPPVSPAVFNAVTQVIENDAPTFLRHAVVQVTQGSADEELAERIVERVPGERVSELWEALTAPIEFGDDLARLDKPLVLAQHRGCLMHTPEGFADAVERLEGADVIELDQAPCADPGFAHALRALCERAW